MFCFVFFFQQAKKKIKFANRTITNIDFRKVIYQGAELWFLLKKIGVLAVIDKFNLGNEAKWRERCHLTFVL